MMEMMEMKKMMKMVQMKIKKMKKMKKMKKVKKVGAMGTAKNVYSFVIFPSDGLPKFGLPSSPPGGCKLFG